MFPFRQPVSCLCRFDAGRLEGRDRQFLHPVHKSQRKDCQALQRKDRGKELLHQEDDRSGQRIFQFRQVQEQSHVLRELL